MENPHVIVTQVQILHCSRVKLSLKLVAKKNDILRFSSLIEIEIGFLTPFIYYQNIAQLLPEYLASLLRLIITEFLGTQLIYEVIWKILKKT